MTAAPQMVVLPCPRCGAQGRHLDDQVQCGMTDCRMAGPRNDPDGAKWNALPRLATAESRARRELREALKANFRVGDSARLRELLAWCESTRAEFLRDYPAGQDPSAPLSGAEESEQAAFETVEEKIRELLARPEQVAGGASDAEAIERLAELEHEQWTTWSKAVASLESISEPRRSRWEKLWRPYAELTEAEKDQDREWARKALAAAQVAGGEAPEEYPSRQALLNQDGKQRAEVAKLRADLAEAQRMLGCSREDMEGMRGVVDKLTNERDMAREDAKIASDGACDQDERNAEFAEQIEQLRAAVRALAQEVSRAT